MGFENKIPKGWVETTLGYLMADKGYIRGPFGSALKRDEMLDDGVPVYEQANAIYNHRKFRYFIGNDKHATLSRFTVKPNDILISCSGTFGKTTIIKEDDPKGIISQALLILRSNPCKINTFYLNYYLNSREGKIKLAGMSHGSVQVNIAKRADVESIEFLLPPLPEQKAIAKVLTAFDDKIELLQAQNKTLETMAQTIFKEWFGKYQVGDELPEGWNQHNFIDLVKHIKPGTNYQPKRVESGIPFINGRHVKNGVIHFRDIKYITEEEYARVHKSWKPEKNDILITRIGTLGNVGIIQKTDLPLALHYNSINIKEDKLTHQFLYFLLKSEYFQDQFHLNKKQSVQEFVTIEAVEEIKISIPPPEILEEKTKYFDNILLKILNNNSQIKSLIKTRDTLLPKLMSGQVRVNNIKQITDA